VIRINSFLQLARSRRSVREYKRDAVPDDALRQLVEAARWAPTALNTQPWEFIVVTDAEVKSAIARHARYFGMRWPQIDEAPALVVVCARRVTPFTRDDCIFAGATLMLAAADMGLGTCWIGGFKEDVIKRLLGVPGDYLLPGLCTVGWPAGETAPPPKRPVDDMLHRDTYTGGRAGLHRLAGPLEVLGRILRLQFRRPSERPGTSEPHDEP